MALSVDYLYQYTLNLIKKNQAGGLASTEWARHWNGESAAYMDDLVGRFQARSNGKTGANTGLIENETILQKLSPFIKNATIVIAGGNGGKPAGFKYELALRINGKDVHRINHNQIATVNDNVIDPPSITTDTYYAVIYEGYYTFLPSSVTQATLDYIVTPTDIVWGFTIVGGRQVYNAATSVQSQWDDNSNREICKRVLGTLGVSFKDSDFANFGNRVIQTGN
jgi:hypothetical protein